MPRSPGSPTASIPAAAANSSKGLRKTIGDRTLTIFEGGAPPPLALAAAENAAAKMTVKVLRACRRRRDRHRARARRQGLADRRGALRVRRQDRETEASFDLPVELRNDIARLEIAGERSAGAVQLLDKRWRRRAIGIVSGATSDTAQPLLAADFYLTRALAPFADVRARRPRRAAAGDRTVPRPEAADDRAGRCRHAVAGNPRAAQRLDRPGRRAGALRRPAPGARPTTIWCRSNCAAAAAASAAA